MAQALESFDCPRVQFYPVLMVDVLGYLEAGTFIWVDVFAERVEAELAPA
jgi:hypothetical protein